MDQSNSRSYLDPERMAPELIGLFPSRDFRPIAPIEIDYGVEVSGRSCLLTFCMKLNRLWSRFGLDCSIIDLFQHFFKASAKLLVRIISY